MQRLDLKKANNLVSQPIVSKRELKDLVNYFLNEQEKKYMSIKPCDYESEQNKELAQIDCRTFSFLQEILKGDDIEAFSHPKQQSTYDSKRETMEIEGQSSQQKDSFDELQKINQICHDSKEKAIFYYEFYQTWNNKNDKQKMETQSYDHNKMPNFLFNNEKENGSVDFISLDKSKGMIAQKSYSDLEIIQDLIYYDNHLQRFAKTIKWVQNYCMTSEALDPQATKTSTISHNQNSSNHNQDERISIENWGSTQIENERLMTVYNLLKQNQNESAHRYLQDQQMKLPLGLIESVFPYHDYLLSDQNSPLEIQMQLVQSELKSHLLIDIFQNLNHQQTLKERINHYKNHSFSTDHLFDQQIGNQNWLYSLRSAYTSSEDKRSTGEILYFSYLCSNKGKIQNLIKHQNSWYENLWITLKVMKQSNSQYKKFGYYIKEIFHSIIILELIDTKLDKSKLITPILQKLSSYKQLIIVYNKQFLYLHEVIKRFLVIKGLLYDSIEQYYPNYENSFIDFSESPSQNYRKLFDGVGIDSDIYDELKQHLDEQKEDKYDLQIHLILAYLNKDYQNRQHLFTNIFNFLQKHSNQAYQKKDKFKNASTICEFNAKLAFSLFHSQFTTKDSIIHNYDHIIETFAQFLINQDRQTETIVFLKNLQDENIIFGLMARYMAQKSSEFERKKIKQEMLLFGYSDQIIQGILKELVNSQFSTYNNQVVSSVSDSSIIDGLKMFIESCQNNLHTCMTHFLSASRQFLQVEKLPLYQQMREDREIASMIECYKKQVNVNSFSIEILRDEDPFLNQLSAFDDLLHCQQLLNNLKNIYQTSKSLQPSDILRSSAKKSLQHQMIQENDYVKDSQVEKASEFIGYCEKTFFKYNEKTRTHYILIDIGVSFSQAELKEYNSHNITDRISRDLSSQYLKIFITKCIDIATTYKTQDKFISIINKYLSPSYNAFTLFSPDDQESILKKITALLTQNTQFMRTVLNL